MGLQELASPPPTQIPRPPTPPREAIRSTLDEVPNLFPHNRSTKFPSPASSTEFNTPVDASKKKVEWSNYTDYQEHPDFSSKRYTPLFPVHTPLPSSSERKPPKSILKTRHALTLRDPNDSSTPSPPPTYKSFPIMLESIVQQLAGEDRYSRLDAYSTLSGALKAWSNLPDPKALKDKMGLISQFIQRDLSAKIPAKTAGDVATEVDAVLVSRALILLESLLLKASFAHDFCVFIMDFAIHAFETGDFSKEITRQLLFVVGNQNFTPKVMNAERVGKLITALHTVEDHHANSNAIVAGRIWIYQRLLKQGRSAMLANTIWVEDMLHDMLSKHGDIRTRAIRFGTEAAVVLGKELQVSKAVQEVFDAERDNNSFCEFYAKRLQAMLEVKTEGIHVPQIWIVIVLFLRYNRSQLGSWKHLKTWFSLIQSCINNKDIDVKIQALRAWNQLVFAVKPDENTSPRIGKKLCDLFECLLEQRRQSSPRYQENVFASVYNLLYYAFRPNATFQQVDRYWDEYVVRLMSLPEKLQQARMKGAMKSQALGEDFNQPCLMLTGLLNTTPSIWIENKAFEPKNTTPAELPGLSSKWIRKNTSRILAVMEPLIQNLFTNLSNPDSPVSILWDTFCEALKVAGAKEIKVSNDAMSSIAQIFGMLYRLWNQQLVTNSSASVFRGFGFLLSAMISKLGVLPFTEKLLSLGLPDKFDVITTPSTRPNAFRGEIKCPLHHIIGLSFQVPAKLRNCHDYGEMIVKILRPFFDARESRRTRLDFLHEVNQLTPDQDPSGELGNSQVWEVLVKFTHQALQTPEEARNSGPSSECQLGSEYRCIIKILEAGLGTSSDSTFKAASTLLQALLTVVKLETGDSGVAIAVTEPLARGLLERRIPIAERLLASHCTTLLANAQYPKDRLALDAARRSLWGSAGGPRMPTDLFGVLYELASRGLKFAYSELSLAECRSLISEVCGMLERCPAQYVFSALEKLQGGLSCWIEDADHKLTDQELAIMLCERTNKAIKTLPNFTTLTLKKLSDLISCGLECRHRFVANAAIEMWNSTFGNERLLEYPPRIIEALARLRSVSELKLPLFPSNLPKDFNSAPPDFYDSQDCGPAPASWSTNAPSESYMVLSKDTPKDTPKPVIEVERTTSKKRRFEGPPELGSRKQPKRQATPKLRHDDSQVQYTSIQSSPMSDAVMDSQILTENQREVKERQRIEAATILRKFASSPAKKKERSLSKHRSRTKSPSVDSSKETPGTPIMNGDVPNIFDDGVITSSPTPRRGDALLPDSDVVEPPSSPPEPIVIDGPSAQSRGKPPVISQDYEETSLGEFTLGSRGILRPAEAREPELPRNGKNEAVLESPQRGNGSKAHTRLPSTPVRGRIDRTRSQRSPEPETEVFMDALSTPAKFTPTKNGKQNDMASTNESLDSSPIHYEDSAPLEASQSQGSQGMARGLFNAAMNLPTNIKSFISPPKPKTIASTFSSPLDDDSVLRVMKKYNPPQTELPVRLTFSQPTTNQDYDDVSVAHSSGGSKKRKRVSMSPEGNRNRTQASPFVRVSQESWKPDTQEELLISKLIKNAQMQSTIPETPIRPGINGGAVNADSFMSRGPLTRSTRLTWLQSQKRSSNVVEATAGNLGARELGSSRFSVNEIELRTETPKPSSTDLPDIDLGDPEPTLNPSTELPDIDLGDPEPSLDFGYESSLDLGDNGFTSTPERKTTRAQINAPTSADDAWESTEEEIDSLPPHRRPAGSEELVYDEELEDEVEQPAERGSSPSMQLIRDSNESSQRLQMVREASSLSASSRHVQEVEPGGAAVDLSSVSIEDLLKAVSARLTGVGLERRELYRVEALMLDVRGKLIQAEDKGKELDVGYSGREF